MIKDNYIYQTPLNAYKLKNIDSVWISDIFTHQLSNSGLNLENLAFAIPDNQFFLPTYFDFSKQVTIHAESYGGYGTRGNGGGVRAANLLGYQLKGIGNNYLLGGLPEKPDYKHYSFGELLLHDAAIEVVFSKLVDHLLPFGSIKHYGIVSTGIHFDFDQRRSHNILYRENGIGVILIRDIAVRPAHFIPSYGYIPNADRRPLLANDLERCRYANLSLFKIKKYNLILKTFLKNTATQFVYARLSNLMHGTVTAANISLEGKWLDLTYTSTVQVNSNRKEAPEALSFLDEAFYPAQIAYEMSYNYNKFAYKKPLNYSIYLAYSKLYNQIYLKGFIDVWELSSQCFTDYNFEYFVKFIEREMFSNYTHTNDESFTTSKNVLFINKLFFPDQTDNLACKANIFFLEHQYSQLISYTQNKIYIKRYLYIKYFVRYFMLSECTNKAIKKTFLQLAFSTKKTNDYINYYYNLIENIFCKEKSKTYLYNTDKLTIYYNLIDGCFYIKNINSQYILSDIHKLKEKVLNIEKYYIDNSLYNLSVLINKLYNELCKLN